MGENMLDFLRAEMLQARLRQDTEWVRVVSTAIGDLEREFSKDFVSKDQLISWAKSQLKAIEKSYALANAAGQVYTPDVPYVEFLRQCIPDQMSEDDLYDFYSTYCADATSLGQLMTTLKSMRQGQYDGKLAASVARAYMTTVLK